MGAVAVAVARRARASLRGRAARAHRAAGRAARPGGGRRAPARADAGRRRSLGLVVHRARGDAGAGARVHGSPLGVSAQGGRSAFVGAAAPLGPAEGRDGGGPGRRVRQRPPGRHPRRAVRARHGRRRPRFDLRRLSRSDPGCDAGHGQPDVDVRAAPPSARRDRRSPGAVRDDVIDPEPALRGRAAAPRIRRRRVSVLRRARGRRCRARERRRGRPGRRPGEAGSRARRRCAVGGAGAAGDRRPLGAAHGVRLGGRRIVVATVAGGALTESELRAVFDAPAALTIGIEEEVMLVDPVTLDLAPVAAQVLDGEAGLKLELPASQAEIVTAPTASVPEAMAQLADGRRRLAQAAGDTARPIAAGVHPHAAPLGALNGGERYDAILDSYRDVARGQLVCALQIHVAVGSADATLRVHDALRSHLPELAALAANAPFYAGRDTGYASVRPLIGALLPRQGVPPAIGSWAAFADMLAWTGDPKTWWFEVRPHPVFGTLELRVCDAQATVAEAAGIAAFVHALVAWLADRDGDSKPAERWRIEHNRFAAARHGLDAEFADL